MASRNKLLPVWGSHLGNTRACLNTCWGIHVGGKGVLLWTGKKFKDFQFCLPILPAYLPLKFPNGQFPLKTPGPISPTTLEQNKNKKNFLHVGSTRGWERGTSLNGQTNLKIFNFVCQSYLHIFPWNFLADNSPWKYQVLLARQNWNQRKKIAP
jgi:hypothetical protein